MKLLLVIFFWLIATIPSNAQKPIQLTITKIDSNTIIAKRSYQVWKGICKSVIGYNVGDKIVAYFSRRKDSCNCYFKRYK